ncbi:MAG: hypothetical protein IPI60_16145 [Saprospiraceae bacterium]|nr:hypothetical protein [Saprospiraceae bacterium]
MKPVLMIICCCSFSHCSSFSPECKLFSGEKVAQNTWEKWGPWKPNISLVPFQNEARTLRQYWNWISSNGVGTVGPRRLEVGEGNQEGTILGQTQRTFVTPPSFNNQVEITINKYDGKAETSVVICTHEANGNMQNETSYTFPNENTARTKKFTVNNAKGKIIIVAMRNKSVGNKFEYRVKAD